MLDTKLLRNDLDAVVAALAVKGFSFDVPAFTALETERREVQQLTETLQNERNTVSKSVGKAKAAGEDVQDLLSGVAELGAKLDTAKAQFNDLQERYDAFLAAIPNIPHESVPAGSTEDDNIEVARWGDQPQFNFTPRDHVDLGSGGSLDFDAASQIAGSRFVVMHGQLARLQRALIQFMLDTHANEHGYEEIYVPYVVNRQSLFGTGQLPKFEEDLFRLDTDQGYFLAPTAEVPVTNVYRDTILDGGQLPIKHVCHSPCFRSEAGSYGRDTRGIIRQHQFEKVELVQLVRPEDSWQALEELTEHAESILRRLELPYRKVVLCGGDLGFSAAKTYDLEVWLPGQSAYREISSCSNAHDFQARRLQARYRPAAEPGAKKQAKPELLHTLNGSGLAVGRTLVAVMENYQDGDGNLAIPDVLRSYMGGATQLDLSGR